jgi:1-hydroxycarotenoid 3,4-desaturase
VQQNLRNRPSAPAPRRAPRRGVPDAVVIGAGVGGLSAAIGLASRGLRVDLIEAHARAGGKMGIGEAGGVEFDTGPSVLTLPAALDDVLRQAGTSLADEIELTSPAPAFRYLYPDGTALDIHAELEATRESVRRTLGDAAAGEFHDFLRYARRIWDAASAHFVYGPAPGPASFVRAGLSSPTLLRDIDPLRSMWGAIRRRVRSEQLRWLFARYATYNGSDVRRAPATLNCIAHVELALGGYGVRGGMYEITRALLRAAERVGVRVHLGTRAERIEVEQGRVRGVATDDGRSWRADVVVANADAAHVFADLLPRGRRIRGAPSGDRSMSAWVGILRARRRAGGERRVAHTVLFPDRYLEEFADIFDRDRPPAEPTVYLCAQEACHDRAGWADHEPVFLMANAPALRDGGGHPGAGGDLRDVVLARLRHAGLCDADDELVFERSPAQLAAQFPGSGGSIYGMASNSPLSAFRRPPNRVRGVGGLYLASGSAHPGGGVPLCLVSGRSAARAALEDCGLGTQHTDRRS